MADEYVYKISSRYLQKWLRYDIKHFKNRHFPSKKVQLDIQRSNWIHLESNWTGFSPIGLHNIQLDF